MHERMLVAPISVDQFAVDSPRDDSTVQLQGQNTCDVDKNKVSDLNFGKYSVHKLAYDDKKDPPESINMSTMHTLSFHNFVDCFS